MDPETTVFEWGSISKTFVWVSVMQLVEDRKIDLETDIRTYLPDGFLKNLRFAEPVTLIHLMNHTAGFEEELLDLRYYSASEEIPFKEVLSAHQPKQVYPPGTVSAYSNYGAALAALIVEEASGQSYKDLSEIIYVFLTIFLYLLKCPQSLILSALRAFCFCGKPHISRSIFLYFPYQTWLKSW